MGRYSDLLDTKEPAALPGQAPTSGRYSSLFDEPAADLAAVDVQPERTLTGTLGDVATTVAKGVVAVPEALTGLADIPTGGRAGKVLEDAGVDFGQMQAGLDQYLSPAQKAAQQKVTDAEGFTGKLKAAVTNPSTIAVAVGESLPLMLTGGAAGRLLGSVANLAKTSVLPAAFGEGVMAAGSAAEGIRQQTDDGLLTGKQALLAGGAGAGTALFGFLGGKVAQKLGIADVDIAAAGGDVLAAATQKGITRRALEGAFTEGVLEELPQSVQEQMLNNIALDKDVWDGVDEAAAMGMLAGAAMGGPFAAVNPGKPTDPTPPQAETPTPPTSPATPPAPPKDEIDQRIDAIDRQTQAQTGQIADPDLKATVDAMLNEARRGPTAEVPVYDAEVVQDRAPKPAALPPVDERLALPEPTVINAGGPINLPSDRGGYFYGTRDEGQTGNEPLVAAVVDLDRKIANLESLPEAARTDTAQANLERLTQERQALLTTLKERSNDLSAVPESRVEVQQALSQVRLPDAEITPLADVPGAQAVTEPVTVPTEAQPAAPPVAPAPAVTPPADNPQAVAVANLTAPVTKGRGKNAVTAPNGTAFTITDPNFPGRDKYVFAEDTKGNLSIVKPDGTVQKASEGIANRVFLAKKQGMTAPYVAPQADPLASQPEAPAAVVPAPVAPVVSQEQPGVSSKQPWQMTPSEYVAGITDLDEIAIRKAAHPQQVKAAIASGEAVPAPVLEAYKANQWAKAALGQPSAPSATPSFTTYTPQPGDVAAKSGPFKTQKQAQNRRTAGLVKTHDVVAVAGGYVLRPNVETATAGPLQFSPDDLDAAKARSGYAHTSHTPGVAAGIEQRDYVTFMEKLRDDLAKDLQSGNEAVMAKELERVKQAYLTGRYRVLSVRSNAVSAHIAGGSKFNSKQAGQRSSAIDRAEEAFDKTMKAAVAEAYEATGVAKVLADKRAENDRLNTEAKAEVKRREQAARNKELTLPIINEQGPNTKAITSERWASVPKDYKSILVSADGTYRYRSMIVDGALTPVYLTDKPAKEKPTAKAEETAGATLAGYADLRTALRDGKLTEAGFKATFAAIRGGKDALTAELETLTKPQLFERFPGLQWRYKNEKKAEVVSAAYRNMLSDFVLGDSLSYGMGKDSFANAVQVKVDGYTQDDLDQYAADFKQNVEERKQRAAELAEAVKDPKTLEDFTALLRGKMGEGLSFAEARLTLTPEQRAAYDTLAGEKTRSERKGRKDERRDEVRTADQKVSGQIIETTHTQKGHALFVVQLSERVSKEDYTTLNAAAKKLGGYYSSFRGRGAVPGFQFKTRDEAEAFNALAGGDKTAAQDAVAARRDAFDDNREQTAVERLRDMADALEERAQASLNQDRKANTSRRASMAASAEAAANSQLALAKTMRNLAAAVESGKAQFLDRVRQKVQVEYLTEAVRLGKWNELKAKYPEYAEREKRNGERPTIETADFADWPTYTMYRSDLAKFARELLDKDGTKKLGQQILKVADDVTDAYMKFAKENLTKVANFARKDGGLAAFASRQDAEAAIARSGYKGKAIVLPFKRGENLIIMSPSEAVERGVWQGDNDKRITLPAELGAELVAKVGRSGKVKVPWQLETVHQRRELLKRMGIEQPAEFRAALREFIALQEGVKEPDKTKQMERAMIGRKKDGLDFFPTPQATADEMITVAGIEPGMSVLEPSAGMGNIAERIREAGVDPDVIELSNDRKELLEAKGFNVVGRDFLEMDPRGFTYGDTFRHKDGRLGVMRGSGGLGSGRVGFIPEGATERTSEWVDRDDLTGVSKNGSNSGYDRIIMNPPFSDRRDAEHVQHAFELLKPGGRLVALMGEGVFFGNDKKAQAFRDWLDEVGATDEKLAEGTFLDPSLPVNTGVAARMVVIDKPETAMYQRTDGRQGIDVADLEAAFNPADYKGLKGAINFVQTEDDLPINLQRTIDRDGLSGAFAGVYWQGQTYLIGDNLSSVKEGQLAILHESRHFGLERVFGSALEKRRFMAMAAVSLNKQVVAWLKSANMEATQENRLVAAEEVLVDMVRRGEGGGIVDRFIAKIAEWVRSIFPNLKLTKAEMRSLIAEVDQFVKEGEGVRYLAGSKGFEPAYQRTATPLGSTITVDGVERPTTNSEGRPIHPTEEGVRNFWKWFGESRVVDEQGRPLVVYHGTIADFDAFDPDAAPFNYESDRGKQFFLDNAKGASDYALGTNEAFGGRPNVMPVYLNISNPRTEIAEDYDSPSEWWDAQSDRYWEWDITEKGYDGLVVEHGDETMYVTESPTQIKSAIGNTGAFSPGTADIRYARTTTLRQSAEKIVTSPQVQGIIGGLFSKEGTNLSGWQKTIGTMYGTALKLEKAGKPEFMRVFLAGQEFLTDVATLAAKAESLAPNVFPKFGIGSGMFKGLSKADAKAIAKPLYDGTLYGEGVLQGKVFTDAELKAQGLTDKQIGLYREARAAVDQSLDDVARSFVARYAKDAGVQFDREMDLQEMADSVAGDIQGLVDDAQAALDAEREAVETVKGDVTDPAVLAQLDKHLAKFEREQEAFIALNGERITKINELAAKAKQLKKAGYFPLMRFGEHTVTMRDADGNVEYFSLHESKIAAATQAATLRGANPHKRVAQGTMSKEKYELYGGLNPEALQLFAEHLGAEEAAPYQEYLKQAVNNRSVLKRMIHRKGTEGFNEDAARTLASFIVSNARQASSQYHLQDMRKAADAIPDEMGDVKDLAINLWKYVSKPTEEASKLRGYMFFHYLGGSLASGLVNMTQPVMMCVDEETEALTRSGGWKRHTELTVGEEILTYDIETDTCRWAPLRKINSFDHKGPMFTMESGQISSRTTDGHRWPVVNKNSGKRYTVTNGIEMPRGHGSGTKGHKRLNSLHSIPTGRRIDNLPGDPSVSDAFVSLCGWIATEGTFGRDSRKHRPNTYGKIRSIEITQSQRTNPDKVAAIRDLLVADGITFNERADVQGGAIRFRLSSADTRRFTPYLTGNKVPKPELISSLTERQLHLFINAMIDGDGTRPKGTPQSLFFNTDKELVDVFQMAVTLTGGSCRVMGPFDNGCRATKPIYRVRVSYGRWAKSASVVRSAKPPTLYDGTVWCPTVDTGFWVARRAGRTYCTGNTAPYLSQFGNAATVVKHLTAAAKMSFVNPASVQGNLGNALRKAEASGVTAPQEIYQLTAMAANRLFASRPAVNIGLKAWGGMFSLAEVFNRRTTFIAAYQMAVKRGSKTAYEDAVRAVSETQGIYNRGNRPTWGRGVVGSTLFTFKQFSVMYLELFSRLPLKQKMLMLGILILASGAEGAPGSDDLDDLIDTLMQWGGFAWNTKAERRELAENLLGETGAEFALKGVSAAIPLDLHARLGMSNLIPGSGIFKQSSTDKTRDIQEFFGPAAGLLSSLSQALTLTATGQPVMALRAAAPRAVQSLLQGAEMASTGYGHDSRGRKTLAVTPSEALVKATGFNPTRLARESDIKTEKMQDIQLLRVRKEEIVTRWVNGILNKSPEDISAARDMLARWNRNNPELRLVVTTQQIRSRVKAARITARERFLKAVPKAQKRAVIDALG